MKKILYTLLVGLTIVSCDKNEMDESIQTSPAAESKSIDAVSEDSTDEVLSIIDILLGNVDALPKAKRGSASNASKGSDYVAVHIFTEGDYTYMTVLDESNDDLCLGDQEHALAYLNNPQGDGSVLNVEDEDETVLASISGDWSFLFDAPNNSIIKLDADLVQVGIASFDESNSATIE